ncbi:sulfatase-like hydrolase/transferase [Saccharicrinis aurantiacus]|uniref:sulfatase-like hydrolase/transferase n=1 Tax=Saccharicrinis aurantiacus TaxID=1849719 RepID=UPI00094F91C0|nr:sulfatase-like hydrolase/transferase [Saccharicrinis aurantiacus]
MKLPTFKLIAVCIISLMAMNTFAKKTKKPNVLVIYTDDHRYTGIHALGGQAVRTPNIDQLANTGIVFTNAYLMGAFSGATCMPSRAMLLSGRQLFTLKGQGHTMPKEHITIGETFKNNGYHTHMVGKWHQDRESLSRSFDDGQTVMGIGVYLTDHYRMPLWDWDKTGAFPKKDAYLLEFDANGNETRRPVAKTDKRGPTGTEELGPHTSEIFARNAATYIKNYKDKEPFFMYLAFHAPHDPRQAPKKYQDMYPTDQIQLPPSYLPQHPFDNGALFLRDEELGPWPRTPQVAREHLAAYYAIITHLDAQIGKVIQALKESGEYDNTIIILSGDSGLAVGCHGLLGKQNVYDEDGIHVPFIVSGGATKQSGVRSDALCYIHDIYPTTCDLAGIQAPASVNGLSLKPVINGEVAQVRDHTYHAYRQHQRAYRKGDFKLIEFVKANDYHKKKGEFVAGSRVTLLFNTANDPWETTNLAFLPQYHETLKTMQAEMQAEAIKLGDNTQSTGEKYNFWDYYN